MEWTRNLRIFNAIGLVVSTTVGVGLWLVFRPSLPPQIPLYYGLPWGETQLAKPIELLVPMAVATIAAGVIGELAARLRIEKPLAGMMVGTGVAIQIIAMFAILRIVLLVT